MKTNKSYTKRIKVTKRGKVLARKPGQDHFNAKEARVSQLGRKQTKEITVSNKAKARFLSK